MLTKTDLSQIKSIVETAIEEKVDPRFEKLETRFEKLETKTDKGFKKLEKKLDKDFDYLDRKYLNHNDRTRKIENYLGLPTPTLSP